MAMDYPPSESQILLTNFEQNSNGFVAMCIQLPVMNTFAVEPPILTGIDRITIHIAGTGKLEHQYNVFFQSGKAVPGNFSILPRGNPSAWKWNFPATILNIYFLPTVYSTIQHQISDFPKQELELGYYFNEHDVLVENIGWAIFSELRKPGEFGKSYIKSLVDTLSIHTLRYYSAHSVSSYVEINGLPSHQLAIVKKYIREQLSENITLVELASLIGLSPYHFSRQFKKSIGLSPHQYLIQCRLKEAKKLLLERKLTLAQIAHQVGFSDQSHFTNHFRRFFGVTPIAMLNKSKNFLKDDRIIQ